MPAPEQVSPAEFGGTDVRTDLYQLGALFYELVTGSIPFGGESIVEVGNAIVRDEPIPPTEYNPDAEAVEKIILKCLAKNPPTVPIFRRVAGCTLAVLLMKTMNNRADRHGGRTENL